MRMQGPREECHWIISRTDIADAKCGNEFTARLQNESGRFLSSGRVSRILLQIGVFVKKSFVGKRAAYQRHWRRGCVIKGTATNTKVRPEIEAGWENPGLAFRFRL
jgi:hypothetical protein